MSSLMYKIPKIEALTNFSSKLPQSIEYVAKFIGGRGIQVLLQTISNRFDASVQLQKQKYQFRHLDIAILYECLECLKTIMYTTIGMEQLVSISDAISTIARCLNFQCKIITLLVLDMLTYCSCFSIHSAIAVYHGVQVGNDTIYWFYLLYDPTILP